MVNPSQKNETSSSRVSDQSRRSFLAQTAGITAGIATASMTVPAVHAAGDETLKVALIGCGGRGTGAAAQALSTAGPVKLWAMADLFPDKLDQSLTALTRGMEKRYDREGSDGFGTRVDVAPERKFIGFDAYQRAIDSGADVAILTTFPHFRPEQFEYAVDKGLHVFMEKPVAVDAPGIRRILAADQIAKQKNLKIGVGLQRHHNNVYEQTVARIHDGALGHIHLLRCYWNASTSSGLRAREDETEMEFQLRNKYMFTWLIGDHNVEQHVHNIDVCNWVMDGHPISANGMGGRQWRNGYEHGEIFDHHFVEYTYADDVMMYSQCRQIPGCWNSVAETVHGTRAIAELGQRQSVFRKGEQKLWESVKREGNPYQTEHDVLFDAIRNDKPHNEAEYGATSTMTAIMGRMATYSGHVVTWDEALNSDLALVPDRYAMDGTPPIVPNEEGYYACAMPGQTKAW